MTTNNNKPTRNQQREHARELARENRLKEVKRARTRKIVTWASVGLVVAVVASVITFVSVANNNKVEAQTNQTYPRNMASDGVLFTGVDEVVQQDARKAGTDPVRTDDTANPNGKVDIVLYADYSCPHCAEFEAENADTLERWLDEDRITLEIHPVAVLGTEYAARGANAAACVADSAPEIFFDFQKEAYKQSYNTTGLSNRALYNIVSDLDASDESKQSIRSCINNDSFGRWVADSSYTALNVGIGATDGSFLEGTPTVLVNGAVYPYSYENDVFTSVIEDIMAGGTIEAPGEIQENETSTIE